MPEWQRQCPCLRACLQLRVAQHAAALHLVTLAAWAASAGVHRERGQGGGRALPARAGGPVLPPRGCQAGAVAGHGDAQRRGAAAGAARAHGRHRAGVWKPDGEGARPWKGGRVVAPATNVGGRPSQHRLVVHVSRCGEAVCLSIGAPPSSHIICACAPLQGFQRVADGLADTCLDNPAARERFVDIVSKARLLGPFIPQLVTSPGLYAFLMPVKHALSPAAHPMLPHVCCLRVRAHEHCPRFPHLLGATVYTLQARSTCVLSCAG